MKKLISLLLVCFVWRGALLLAQDLDKAPGNAVKVIRVHGNAQSIANAAVSWSGVHYTVSEPLKAIVVRGKPEDLAGVERTIQELDALSASAPAKTTTEKNLELTVYVIGGSQQPITGVEEVSGENLAPVVKQLHAIFPYTHYTLLSTMLVRAAQGAEARTNGVIKALSNPETMQPVTYEIRFNVGSVSVDTPATIHLASFHFEARVPQVTGSGFPPIVSLHTDVDLREGQKVVIGKANVSNSDTCYFLVLSARMVS